MATTWTAGAIILPTGVQLISSCGTPSSNEPSVPSGRAMELKARKGRHLSRHSSVKNELHEREKIRRASTRDADGESTDDSTFGKEKGKQMLLGGSLL